MRKLIMLAAMLAVAALTVAPALAQGFPFNNNQVFDNDLEQEAESGDFEAETEISLSGDNSNQCAPVQQFGNTGNNQNATTLTQYFSFIEDFEVEDAGTITFEPEFENSCEQSV